MVMMWGGLTRRQQSKRIIFFSKSSNLQTKVLLQGTIYPTKNELAPYYLASKERELSALSFGLTGIELFHIPKEKWPFPRNDYLFCAYRFTFVPTTFLTTTGN